MTENTDNFTVALSFIIPNPDFTKRLQEALTSVKESKMAPLNATLFILSILGVQSIFTTESQQLDDTHSVLTLGYKCSNALAEEFMEKCIDNCNKEDKNA